MIFLRDMALFDFFLCDSRKTTKSADFGLFFDFACFQASFDVFCMRWDVRNIILEVQTMGSESLQACKHSKFHLSKNHCCTVYTGISRFSIFEEVWWKVVFSVKSWETSRLYHVKEHSFGFYLSQNLSIFVKNWSF